MASRNIIDSADIRDWRKVREELDEVADAAETGDKAQIEEELGDLLFAAANLARKLGVETVVGFTGSSIWPYVAMFPPVPAETIERYRSALLA